MNLLEFGDAARSVTSQARKLGLGATVVARSKPTADGARRTLCRAAGPNGDYWRLAVDPSGRDEGDVVADLIDGVIAANGISLHSDRARHLRQRLGKATATTMKPAPPAGEEF